MCVAEVLVAVVITSLVWGFWILYLMYELDFAKNNLRLEQEYCAELLKPKIGTKRKKHKPKDKQNEQ